MPKETAMHRQQQHQQHQHQQHRPLSGKKPKFPLPVPIRKSFQFVGLFFGKSGIHGLAYLVKAYLTLLEKCFWFVLLIVSLIFCIQISLESLDRYNTKSTVVALEKDHYYWNTTMPGITICPLSRLSKQKFDKYCRQHNILGEQKREFWLFMESLANSSYMNFENIKHFDSVDKLQIKPENYMQLIYNLTDDDTFSTDPKFRVRAQSDARFIRTKQILTEFGLCYMTNNYLAEKLSSKYLLFGEYPEENESEKNETFYSVRSGNLFDGEITYSFIGFVVPINIYLHSAYEVMQVERGYGFTLEAMEFETQTVEILTTDNFRESSSVAQRKCRFNDESNLIHYPTAYTKNICLQECRIRMAYELCKCIPHFYPNRNDFIHLVNQKTGEDIKCRCLQNCEDANIIIENIQVLGASKDLLGSIGALAIVKHYPLIRYKRQIIFTFTDLLVSIGGTAGFFLGFSVLGAIEILYYFTLRFFWYLRGYKE